MTAGLVPVRQEAAPLRRKIASAMREAIKNGRIGAGQRLFEKDLCRDLGVSRTSLREALRELEAEGLLVNTARGLTVADMTPHEARNIYRVRGALEVLAAEQFAERSTPLALRSLKAAAEALDRAYQGADMPRIVAAKTIFYEELCAGAANPVILDTLRRLNSRTSQLRIASLSEPDRLAQSIAEIRALVAALEAGDVAAARKAAAIHVENAATAGLRRFENISEERERS